MPALTRRAFFVLGSTGAAGAVLAACGAEDERRTESGDAELLTSAVAAEMALGEAYASADGDGGDAGAVLAAAARASARRLEQLESLAAERDTGAIDAGAGNGSDPQGAGDAAVAAYREAAGLLTESAQRSTMAAFLAQVAGELAAIRVTRGEDPVPFAFVTGGEAEPYEVPELDDDEEDSE